MKTLLLVDDDTFITSAYRSRFQSEGYLVEVAPSGGAALSLLKTLRPDVVLLDLQMPGVNGVDVLKRIRANPSTRAVPVVVFSNIYMASLVEEAWKAGASRVISKTSCTPNQLVDAVRNALAASKPVAPKSKWQSMLGIHAPVAPLPPAPPAPVPAAVEPAPAPFHVEDWTVEQLHRRFTTKTPAILQTLQDQMQAFLKAHGESPRREQLQQLYRTMHGLVGNAGIAGLGRVAQLASAIEALFQELIKRPASINVSTVRTIMRSLVALKSLCERTGPEAEAAAPPLVLVVDDDVICRRSMSVALEKANLRVLTFGNPLVALNVLEENHVDLAFLDVDMPEMTGFALCNRMRALPTNQKTPVVFVTALTNFEELSKSSLLENNEVIAKPFVLIELAVKALTYLLYGGIASVAPSSAAPAPEPEPAPMVTYSA